MLDGSHYGVHADERQRKMLRLWIEVGAPYPGTYAALGCGTIGNYAENRLSNDDMNWPTTQAAAKVIDGRCAACHRDASSLPRSLSDERKISFWDFDVKDPRLRMSRHIVFNLTRPDKSLMLLAPLAESAGGLGLCRGNPSSSANVFASAEDADYKTLLAMVTAGKEKLDAMRRFDMPGFRPCAPYLREMEHYGILPTNVSNDTPLDPYALDRRYWESLWYRPPALPAAAPLRPREMPRAPGRTPP
jgi:hypothetical protein